ncbi:MAG: hypothetical protein R6U32_06300 [Candidatus Woesearchaeota archaeon]
MAVPKKLSAMKRFGARYGRSLKQKFVGIENLQRKKYKCPYCSSNSVKRESVGIWLCRKCDAKFASRAYTITKRKALKDLIKEREDVAVEPVDIDAEAKKKEEEEINEKIPS